VLVPLHRPDALNERPGTTRRLLLSLRAQGQVPEADHIDVPLQPGQTHVYVKKPGQKKGRLVEMRKLFFKR
jgi:hypothetical protein